VWRRALLVSLTRFPRSWFPRLNSEYATDESKSLTDGFEALEMLVGFGQTGRLPTSVRSAMEHLEKKEAVQFKGSLLSSALGNSIWVEASSQCAAGALDAHSEELFARGLAVLQMELLPKPAGDTNWTNITLDEAARGQVCDLLHEALRDVAEAFQQWSKTGMENAMPKVCEFFQHFGSLLQVLNWCEWAALVKSISAISGVMSFGEGPAVPRRSLVGRGLRVLDENATFQLSTGPSSGFAFQS
jgi:hypothetical protein